MNGRAKSLSHTHLLIAVKTLVPRAVINRPAVSASDHVQRVVHALGDALAVNEAIVPKIGGQRRRHRALCHSKLLDLDKAGRPAENESRENRAHRSATRLREEQERPGTGVRRHGLACVVCQ